MSVFDKDLFDTGLAKRKATLGEEYVEQSLANADEFTRPFQEAMTAWCWGFGWGDEVIDAKNSFYDEPSHVRGNGTNS